MAFYWGMPTPERCINHSFFINKNLIIFHTYSTLLHHDISIYTMLRQAQVVCAFRKINDHRNILKPPTPIIKCNVKASNDCNDTTPSPLLRFSELDQLIISKYNHPRTHGNMYFLFYPWRSAASSIELPTRYWLLTSQLWLITGKISRHFCIIARDSGTREMRSWKNSLIKMIKHCFIKILNINITFREKN